MTIEAISIWVVLILLGVALLSMLLFGTRGLAYGKVKPTSIAMVLVPIVLIVVLGFAMETWAQAAIWTVVIMFALAGVALLYTGIRGLISG